jgi:glycosyltransferase involved in cell wall biosynthesis
VEIAEYIKTQKLPYIIVAIGSGPLQVQIQNQIEQRKLETILILLGEIPNRQIVEYYQAADIFLMPSRIEEFGRVMVEAMAAGLPVVATNTLGSQYLLTGPQQQYIVKQAEYLKLPQLAHQIIQNPKLYRQLSQHNLNQAKHFDLKIAVEEFKKLVLA